MTLSERGIGAGARELPEHTKIYNVEDVYVRARCYAVSRGDRTRYEILLDGFGQYAIVDVARAADIPRYIEQALDGYASASKLRKAKPYVM